MLSQSNRGFTLGKFAPLHAGHQQLIEAMLSEMDAALVIIYDCPETTPVPLPVRAGWLRTLYPRLEVIEAWDGPGVVGDTPEIKQLHENYLRVLLAGRTFTHFYSNEFYGEHISRAFRAVDRRCGPPRTQMSISGTLIRADTYRYRQYLHPVVYRDLVSNVVILGAPATGKTTLAQRLAQEQRTVWMPEYGREYWEKHQQAHRLAPSQLTELALGHLEREDALLLEANRMLFTDTNAITTLLFALHYHGTAEAQLERLAAQAAQRYNLVLVCGDEIAYDDTPDRSGPGVRAVMQRQLLAYLHMHNIPYYYLTGNLNERGAAALQILSTHTKYRTKCAILRGTHESVQH
jgi:HTH-type transcriptional regulator, transcriptional repressor of NAD biosynthesis genes